MKKIQTEQEFHARMKQLLEYRIGDMQPFRHKPVEESADEEAIDGLMQEDEEEGEEQSQDEKAEKPAPKPAEKPAPKQKPEAAAKPAPKPTPEAPVDPEKELAPVKDEAPAPESPQAGAIEQKLSAFEDFMQSTAQTLSSINDRLSQIGQIGDKVDKLDHEMKEINPTPEETYDLISKHSYPYSMKLSDVWAGYFDEGPKADSAAQDQQGYTANVEDIEQSMSDHDVEDSFYKDEEDEDGQKF